MLGSRLAEMGCGCKIVLGSLPVQANKMVEPCAEALSGLATSMPRMRSRRMSASSTVVVLISSPRQRM